MAYQPNSVHVHGEDYQQPSYVPTSTINNGRGRYLGANTTSSNNVNTIGLVTTTTTVPDTTAVAGTCEDAYLFDEGGGDDDYDELFDEKVDSAEEPTKSVEDDPEEEYLKSFMAEMSKPTLDPNYKYPRISIMVW